MAELENAVAGCQGEQIERKSHKIKGALRNLVAAASVDKAQELEDIGRSGILDEASKTFSELNRELERLILVLETFRQEHT